MTSDKKFTILVVDDEKLNIIVLSSILRESYTVLAAKDGPTAIKVAKNNKPDLILLDIIMPHMSGFEVLTELKKSNLTMNIPVIFITGMDNRKYEEKGLRLGAVDYIIKPFSNAIVKLRVKTHQTIIEQMRTIEQLSMMDALTNIPNRRSFDIQLNTEWNRAMREKIPLSIMMLDIDYFKNFNDSYGHSHGDEILKTVANTITETLKRSADFAARWGGEEFVILLTGTDLDGALKLATKVRTNVERAAIPYVDGTETKVTISIGVHETIPEMDMQMKDFCEKADIALYLAKKAGRNIVKCYIEGEGA